MNSKDQEQREVRCREEQTTTHVVRGGIFGDLAVSAKNGRLVHVEIRQSGLLKKKPN